MISIIYKLKQLKKYQKMKSFIYNMDMIIGHTIEIIIQKKN